MRAVVVIGSPGVGKSTTVTLLADTLEAEGIANAVVEVESLAREFPYPPLTQALPVLPHVVELHRDAGHDLLLVVATPENQRELDPLLGGNAWIRCHGDPADRRITDRGRWVTARESAGWPGLNQLRNSARALGEGPDQRANYAGDPRSDILPHDVTDTRLGCLAPLAESS